MITIKINDIQKDFILKALDLANNIVDFDLFDEEFKDLYGLNKIEYNKEIEKMRYLLK